MEFTKQIADTIIKQMGGASVLRIMVGGFCKEGLLKENYPEVIYVLIFCLAERRISQNLLKIQYWHLRTVIIRLLMIRNFCVNYNLWHKEKIL